MNGETAVIVTAALWSHYSRWHIVGFKDEMMDLYEPNYPSFMFILSVGLWLSKVRPSSRILARLNVFLNLVYVALVSFFTSNVALRLVWIPLTISLAEANISLGEQVRDISYLNQLTPYLQSRELITAEVYALALFILTTVAAASWVSSGEGGAEALLHRLGNNERFRNLITRCRRG